MAAFSRRRAKSKRPQNAAATGRLEAGAPREYMLRA
jgi:hypothetical protein